MRNSIRRFQDSLPKDYTFQSTKSAEELSGIATCCLMLCTCCTFCVLFLFIALIIVMGITKLVIGGLFYHDCAVEPKLPIYLIVSAIVPMTFQFCCQWCKKNAEMVYTIGVLVLFLFNIAWLAAGTVFYVEAKGTMDTCQEYLEAYQMDTTESPADNATLPTPPVCLSCNETLFQFTLASIIIDWIANSLYACVFGCSWLITKLHWL
ncbi:hypothetical protein BaRGS_00011734 [Batillaria attramentaria]|uniref:Uncharacterized protein n=1 Tax=Batillaria attramentaria TaxID=370345 RepID=A0ABD0LCL0_9CAEN